MSKPASTSVLIQAAKRSYNKIFEKVENLASTIAKIIIVDCSSKNFFASLHTKNLFAPTIEWHKHQPPEVWVDLLSANGFVYPKIRWVTFAPLRGLGQFLFWESSGIFFAIQPIHRSSREKHIRTSDTMLVLLWW